MARKQWEPIILKAYVKTRDGIEVDVDTLTPVQKRKFATHMKITYLNALFRPPARSGSIQKYGKNRAAARPGKASRPPENVVTTPNVRKNPGLRRIFGGKVALWEKFRTFAGYV